jgi:hypothetical protein
MMSAPTEAKSMSEQPPGAISPDGQWRWDGAQWVPNTPPGQSFAPVVAKKHTVRNLGCGCAALLVVLVIVAALAGGSNKTNSTPQSLASPTPDNGVAHYSSVIGPLSSKLGIDLDAVGPPCSAGDTNGCLAAAQTALTSADAFKKTLDSTRPPACLQDAHNKLSDGLTLMIAGITKEIQGINAQDAAGINAGNSDVTSGTDKVTQANTAIGVATC